MANIDEDMMTEMKDAYTLFDRVGDGKIDGDQIPDLLRSMGLNPVGADLKPVTDEHQGKRVEFERFLGIYNQFRNKPEPVREDFIEGFKCYDRDGSGTIDGASLRGMLCFRGDSKLTEEEANDLLAPVEDPKNSIINYEELIKLVMSKLQKPEWVWNFEYSFSEHLFFFSEELDRYVI